ncbi:protein tyrosine/serine phosphatase [Geotalea daltonii FRC-32]|uniref:diphosphoinositol-polyphosphate diphosphatase n=1 Tax=Geotalea daltonii (strain DSM 22248 / JCM 15807 / FRC-32) TaxID=316067 RepID=B9M7Y7_GEODF|nr:tyrosine-protein phosphatase [Geotalea daltonii]ACM18445.1 protein tyrosine/serine phosphatase [Geotalea daltonii FRC-32]
MRFPGLNHHRPCARLMTFSWLIVSCLVLGGTPGLARQTVASAPASPRAAEGLANLPGLTNVGHIAPGIYRGAQPGADGYATLKKMGIKTVIDLRTSESEKAQVEAAGMRAIAVPIAMSRDGLKEKVDGVVALLADPANQPIFVHCRHGQDRTGIVVAAYRMKVDKWSLAEAEKEMQAFGFNDIWINFKKFIRRYGSELKQ